VTDAELAEVIMRLRGDPALKDGEGFCILVHGQGRVVIRGMVESYRMDVKAHGHSECNVVFVGATLTEEKA
jgi:hypothetical protein